MPTISGKPIWSEPRGLHAGHDVPQFSIHRGRLHAMLWQAATERLGPAGVRADRRLVGYIQNADHVEATFQDAAGTREVLTGEALIGADGIHSTLRANIASRTIPASAGTASRCGAARWTGRPSTTATAW